MNHHLRRDAIDFGTELVSQLTERDGHGSSVDGGFAPRTCLPTSMYPEPLVWVPANVLLDHPGEQGSMGKGVRLGIVADRQIEPGAEAKHVLLCRLVPQQESRQDFCSGLHGHPRQARTGASRMAKEVDERPLG